MGSNRRHPNEEEEEEEEGPREEGAQREDRKGTVRKEEGKVGAKEVVSSKFVPYDPGDMDGKYTSKKLTANLTCLYVILP